MWYCWWRVVILVLVVVVVLVVVSVVVMVILIVTVEVIVIQIVVMVRYSDLSNGDGTCFLKVLIVVCGGMDSVSS